MKWRTESDECTDGDGKLCCRANNNRHFVAPLATRSTEVSRITVTDITIVQVSTSAVITQRRVLHTLINVLTPRAAGKQPLTSRTPAIFTTQTTYKSRMCVSLKHHAFSFYSSSI